MSQTGAIIVPAYEGEISRGCTMSAVQLRVYALASLAAAVLLVSLLADRDPFGTETTQASHAGGADAMYVDLDPSSTPANDGLSIGTIQDCARVNENDLLDADEDSTDTLEIDAVVENIPATNPAIATSFVLNFPTPNVTVTEIARPFAVAHGWNQINAGDTTGQSDGTFTHTVVDQNAVGHDGSGAMSRMTLVTSPGVGAGLFDLTLTASAHVDTTSTPYAPDNFVDTDSDTIPDAIVGAQVAIDTNCPLPTVDIEIVSLTLTSISGPTVDAGTNFDLEAQATAQNNGPNPADIEFDIDLSIPADCTRSPDSNQTEPFGNVQPSEVRVSTLTWTVNCSQPSDHLFSAAASVAVTGLADDTNLANNGPINAQENVGVVGEADPKITGVTVTAPPDAATGQPFNVTVSADLHNNGPITPANVDVTYDLVVPAGCSRAPDNPQIADDVSLDQSVTIPVQQSWTVTCTTQGIKTFDGSATLAVDQLHLTDSVPGNNSGQEQADTDTSLGVADVKVTSVTVTSDPTAAINDNFEVTVNTVVHNNGPFFPVNSDIILTLNLPPDCFTPVDELTFEDAQLGPSIAAALPQITFFVACIDQSFHDFTATAVISIDDPNAGDPSPANNSLTSASSTTAVIRTSDVKVSTVTVGAPASENTNTPFDVTVDADLHNNGPDDDAPVDAEVTLLLPPDCTTPTNPVTVPGVLPSSVSTPIPTQTFEVTCTDRSFHDFEATVSLLVPLHVDDQTLGNNTLGSNTATTAVFDVADLKASSVTVAGPPQALTGQQFDVDVTTTVHNNGPAGPANADVTATLNLPPDCSTLTPNPQTTEDTPIPVSAATDVVQTWQVMCTDRSSHLFTAGTSVTLDDFHVTDPVAANDIAGSPDEVIPIFDQADGKIVAAQVLSPPSFISANTNVNITVRTELHNNGPEGPADFDLSRSVTPPAGCTITPPATSSHNLAVSVATIVDAVWTINCVPGSYDITFGNTLSVTGLHVLDPAAGNNVANALLSVTVDTDGDGVPDDIEAGCGSNPNDGSSIPERVDGAFAGVDDDLDTLIDEALPGGASSFDCDGDGYNGAAENHVYTPSIQGDQDPCGTNNSPPTDPPSPIGWPADLAGGGIPDSDNRITIQDIVSFLAPIRYLDTNVGDNTGDVRWDLAPGPGIFLTDINIQDLVTLITIKPLMLGGVKAYGSPGPTCPFPP